MLVGYPMYIIGAVSAVENMQVDTEYKYEILYGQPR